MGEALRRQVSEIKDDVIDALYPIIGKTVRKSVGEAMKKLVEAVDKKLDQTLQGRLSTKKVQLKVTVISEGELNLKDALPFKIEEIFLIHKSNGLLSVQVSSPKSRNNRRSRTFQWNAHGN